MKTGVIFLAILSIFGFLKPNFVSAESGDFSLEPLYSEVVLLEDDQGKSFEITLSNRTASDVNFSVSIVDFGTLDESGGVAFLGGGGDFERRYGLASWMKLDRESFTVPAGGNEKLPIMIENRESLSPGGHYGAVLFRIDRGDLRESGEPTVSVSPSFAALVFVRKSGGEIERMEYEGIENVEKDIAGIPTKAILRFQNSGNVHLVPRGLITVTDMRGRIVRKGILNEESGRMLPESFRTYPVKLRPVVPAWFPGTYTTTIEWRYDGKEEMTVLREDSVFPIILNVLWGLGLAALVVIGVMIRKILLKKARTESFEASQK